MKIQSSLLYTCVKIYFDTWRELIHENIQILNSKYSVDKVVSNFFSTIKNYVCLTTHKLVLTNVPIKSCAGKLRCSKCRMYIILETVARLPKLNFIRSHIKDAELFMSRSEEIAQKILYLIEIERKQIKEKQKKIDHSNDYANKNMFGLICGSTNFEAVHSKPLDFTSSARLQEKDWENSIQNPNNFNNNPFPLSEMQNILGPSSMNFGVVEGLMPANAAPINIPQNLSLNPINQDTVPLRPIAPPMQPGGTLRIKQEAIGPDQPPGGKNSSNKPTEPKDKEKKKKSKSKHKSRPKLIEICYKVVDNENLPKLQDSGIEMLSKKLSFLTMNSLIQNLDQSNDNNWDEYTLESLRNPYISNLSRQYRIHDFKFKLLGNELNSLSTRLFSQENQNLYRQMMTHINCNFNPRCKLMHDLNASIEYKNNHDNFVENMDLIIDELRVSLRLEAIF